jgi:DNA phosphorothioation-dependent restriction protein DptG
MIFKFDEGSFRNVFKVTDDSKTKLKLTHRSGVRIKVFPYTGKIQRTDQVLNLSSVAGNYLCQIDDIKPESISYSTLIEKLEKQIRMPDDKKDIFEDIVKKIFFEEDNIDILKPTNLEIMHYITCENSSEKYLAKYLADVLGSKPLLKNSLSNAISNLKSSSNVLENFITDNLSHKSTNTDLQSSYYRVVDVFTDVFNKDFQFVLKSGKKATSSLISLLEFYYFIYTAQVCLQLNSFVNGNRNKIIPLYFCVDWEKTTQSRLCYIGGWSKLQPNIKNIFAHVNVLEMLNHCTDKSGPIDYIALNNLLTKCPENDHLIATEIETMTDYYRSCVQDCKPMTDLNPIDFERITETESALAYLFECVKKQFEFKPRDRIYNAFSSVFERYCNRFLKSRGRNGLMLNITEEMLIFLTKICIGESEKMRLINLYNEFERRGIFFDEKTKDHISEFYEKLNLIEKKSDSGDAQYVKRIL